MNKMLKALVEGIKEMAEQLDSVDCVSLKNLGLTDKIQRYIFLAKEMMKNEFEKIQEEKV